MKDGTIPPLTLLHSEWPKLHTILAFLSAIGLKVSFTTRLTSSSATGWLTGDLNLWPAFYLGASGTIYMSRNV